jgi:hypothetical protein
MIPKTAHPVSGSRFGSPDSIASTAVVIIGYPTQQFTEKALIELVRTGKLAAFYPVPASLFNISVKRLSPAFLNAAIL